MCEASSHFALPVPASIDRFTSSGLSCLEDSSGVFQGPNRTSEFFSRVTATDATMDLPWGKIMVFQDCKHTRFTLPLGGVLPMPAHELVGTLGSVMADFDRRTQLVGGNEACPFETGIDHGELHDIRRYALNRGGGQLGPGGGLPREIKVVPEGLRVRHEKQLPRLMIR